MFTEAVPVKHIYLVFCIRRGGIKAHCLQSFIRLCRIYIGHPGLRLTEAHLPGPATEVTLVIPVIILCRFDAAICDTALRDAAVLVGHMEKAAVPKGLAPAVHAEECAVRFRFRRKSLSGISIIPADDHRIMVRLLTAFVADISVTAAVF